MVINERFIAKRRGFLDEALKAASEDLFFLQIESIAFLFIGQLLDEMADHKKRANRKRAFENQETREKERKKWLLQLSS